MKQFLSTFFLLCFAISFHLQAQTLSVQGVIKNSDGTAADDGTYSVTFRLYTNATGGSNVWEETQNDIEVKGGTYSALLGSSVSFPQFTAPAYYLGISIEGGQELQPRSQLTAAPFALSLIGDDNIFPNTGNVGIGESQPEHKLHVKHNSAEVHIESTGNSASSALNLQGTGSEHWWHLTGPRNNADNSLELYWRDLSGPGGTENHTLVTYTRLREFEIISEDANDAHLHLKSSNGRWEMNGPGNNADRWLYFDYEGGGEEARLNRYGDLWIAGALTEASDRRLKNNIYPLSDALDNISQLSGYTYHWNSPGRSDKRQIGVIAQEVQAVYPELVHEDEKGMLSVSYTGLVPVLIEATKEQQVHLVNLQNQMDMLAVQNEKMEEQLSWMMWLLVGMTGLLVLLALVYLVQRKGLLARGSGNEWQPAIGS